MFLKLTDVTSNGSRNNSAGATLLFKLSLPGLWQGNQNTHSRVAFSLGWWHSCINGNQTSMIARFGKKRKAGVCLLLPQNWAPRNPGQESLIISDERVSLQFTKETWERVIVKSPRQVTECLNYGYTLTSQGCCTSSHGLSKGQF